MITPQQQENLRNFIFTLRSGFYKQNHVNVLRTEDDEFCPRGIIHDMSGIGWSEPYYNAYTEITQIVGICVDREAEAYFLGVSTSIINDLAGLNVDKNGLSNNKQIG